jgi:hypothetical protein
MFVSRISLATEVLVIVHSKNSISLYLNLPKNTPSTAAGLDGDEFGIVGASPTINCGYNPYEYDVKCLGDCPKGFQI